MSKEKQVMKATSLAELKRYSEGSIVNFPGFGPDMPFVARVRRPSMMSLASEGKIPNALLNTANTLFTQGTGSSAKADEEMMSNMYDLMMIIAKETLIEPTVENILEAGLTLSDDQLLAIFMYTQEGIRGLENFHS